MRLGGQNPIGCVVVVLISCAIFLGPSEERAHCGDPVLVLAGARQSSRANHDDVVCSTRRLWRAASSSTEQSDIAR